MSTRATKGRGKGEPKLSEADIQKTVVDYLQAEGWRAIRTEHAIERADGGKVRRKVGEVGMPDYLFLRYGPCSGIPAPVNERLGWCGGNSFGATQRADEVLWIEFKAPGKSPTPAQRAWHAAERKLRALVLIVNDVDEFIMWYERSGLTRVFKPC